MKQSLNNRGIGKSAIPKIECLNVSRTSGFCPSVGRAPVQPDGRGRLFLSSGMFENDLLTFCHISNLSQCSIKSCSTTGTGTAKFQVRGRSLMTSHTLEIALKLSSITDTTFYQKLTQGGSMFRALTAQNILT